MCNYLSWTGSAGVTGSPAVSFNVYRNSSSPVPIDAGHRIASGLTETEYTDCGRYKNYYYAVTAVNEGGESDPSNEAQASEPCSSAMALTLPVLNVTALTESSGDPVVTKYYFAGGKRVAMDREGVVQWLIGDHLGSTSLVMDDLGSKVAESRHYPYGEERWRWPQEGTFPTDYRFTGQRNDSYTQLVHMGARFYDSELGRWISPDSIIPQPGDPQSLNRFSYALGNPLRYRDPGGHYHQEVHYELTRKWAYQSALQLGRMHGLSVNEADTLANSLATAMAEGNQTADTFFGNASPIPGTNHWRSHKQARETMGAMLGDGFYGLSFSEIGEAPYDMGDDAFRFGYSLHAVQDYFAHFGQGFIATGGFAGVLEWQDLWARDDRSSITGADLEGLNPFSLQERLRHAGDVGHFFATTSRVMDADEFDWNDPWDQIMVEETKYYIWAFLLWYFGEWCLANECGAPPADDSGAWDD